MTDNTIEKSQKDKQWKKIKRKLYDKRNDFTFPIVNFPFTSSNIPASPAYGVYISQLVRYSRAGAQYSDFLDRAQLLTSERTHNRTTQKNLKMNNTDPTKNRG
jgi:hypothetical protein